MDEKYIALLNLLDTVESEFDFNQLRLYRQTLKASQSLSSVLNDPDEGYYTYFWDYFSYDSVSAPTQSIFLQDVQFQDFQFYLISNERFEKKLKRLKEILCNTELNQKEEVIRQIPQQFFKQVIEVNDIMNQRQNLPLDHEIQLQIDAVEGKISDEMKSKWYMFLFALQTIKGLQQCNRKCLKSVYLQKQTCNDLKKKYTVSKLRIIKIKRRIDRIQRINQLLDLIQAVQTSEKTIEQLINGQYYKDAILIIKKTYEKLNQDLRNVQSLIDVKKNLENMNYKIFKIQDQQFFQLSQQIVVEQAFQGQKQFIQRLKQLQNLEDLKIIKLSEEHYLLLASTIDNIKQTGKLSISITNVTKGIIPIVRKKLSEFQQRVGIYKPDDGNQKWLSLSHMHLLIFLDGLLIIFQRIMQTFQAFKQQVIHEIKIESDITQLNKMLGGLFISKLTKIIKIREAYFFDLDPIDISQLNQIINQFSQISEKYFGIKQIQAKQLQLQNEQQYLKLFHQKSIQDLSAAIEKENWQKVDLRLSKYKELENVSQFPQLEIMYLVYESIQRYQQLCQHLQIGFQSAQRLIEYLKIFNSKLCQLILGGGAISLGILQLVNSKHLGLVAQSILFIQHLLNQISYEIKQKIQNYKTLLKPEICKLRQDLQTHIIEIQEKLLSLLQVRAIDKFSKHNPNVYPGSKGYYIRSISNSITGMYNILSSVMQQDFIDQLYTNVFQQFKRILAEQFDIIQLQPQQKHSDLQFLINNLKEKLPDHLSSDIEDLNAFLSKLVSQ